MKSTCPSPSFVVDQLVVKLFERLRLSTTYIFSFFRIHVFAKMNSAEQSEPSLIFDALDVDLIAKVLIQTAFSELPFVLDDRQ